MYGSAAQVRGRSKHLGHVGTAQAAGRAHGAALHGRDGGALAPAAAIWETLGRVLEESWQSLGRPVFSRVNSNTVVCQCDCPKATLTHSLGNCQPRRFTRWSAPAHCLMIWPACMVICLGKLPDVVSWSAYVRDN